MIVIKSSSGTENTVYENAIFTPIFYTDQTIQAGKNTYSSDQHGFVVVWGTGTSLSTFDEISTDYTDLIWIGDGATLQIAEVRYSGENVSSVDLDATNVEYIEPIDMDDPDSVPVPDWDDMAELVRLVCILFGSLMMLAAFRSGNIKLAIVAFLILLVGILFAEAVEDVLERFRIVFTWPEL